MKFALVLAAILAVALAGPIKNRNICGDNESGLKAHPDCHRFYTCDSGYVIENVCPEDLFFNGVYCDYAENVPQCIGQEAPTESEEIVDSEQEAPAEDQILPEVPEPEESKPETPEVPEEESEPVPEEQAPAPENPDVPSTGECPNGPYYYLANPSSANTFVICQNGQNQGIGSCGEGLVFSQAQQACL